METFKASVMLLLCGIHVVLAVEGNDKPENIFSNSNWTYQFDVIVSLVAAIFIGWIMYRLTCSPTVEIHKENYSAVVGERVELKCTVSAPLCVTSVSWQHILPGGRSDQLSIDQRKYQGSKPHDPHLVINKVTKDDEGEYVCTVFNIFTKAQSAPTKLNVKGDPPTLTMNPTRHYKTEGEIAILKCTVHAKPPASAIAWSKEEEKGRKREIKIDNNKYMGASLDAPSLVIDNTEKAHDEGKYICEIENNVGQGSTAVHLVIDRKTLPTKTIDSRILLEESHNALNQRVNFRHSKMAIELSDTIFPPGHDWDKFKELLTAYLSPRDLQEDNLLFFIRKLLQYDYILIGQYKILLQAVKQVSRLAADIIKRAALDIAAIRKAGSGLPKETTAELECTFEGDYNQNLQQRCTSQITQQDPEFKERITVNGGSGSIYLKYTISEATTLHKLTALYLATTLKTKLENSQIVLTDESDVPLVLKTPPRVKPTGDQTDKPTICLSRGLYQVTEGDEVILKCVVVATAETESIQWFRIKNGKSKAICVDNMKYFGGSSNCPSIAISNVNKTDEGMYFCRARNSVGEVESDIAFVEVSSIDDMDTRKDDDNAEKEDALPVSEDVSTMKKKFRNDNENADVELNDASDVMEETAGVMGDTGDVMEDAGGVMDDTGGVMEDTGGVMEDTGGVMENTGGVMKDTGGVMEDTSGVMKDTGGVMEDTGGVMKVTGGVVEDTGGVMKDTGVVMKDTGGEMEDTGGVTGDTGGVMEDIGIVMEDTGGVMEDNGGVMKDTRGVVEATSGVTEDTGGVMKDTGVVMKDTVGVIEDTSGVIKDTGGVTGDTGGVMEDIGSVMEDTGGVMEDTGDVIEDTRVLMKDTSDVKDLGIMEDYYMKELTSELEDNAGIKDEVRSKKRRINPFFVPEDNTLDKIRELQLVRLGLGLDVALISYRMYLKFFAGITERYRHIRVVFVGKAGAGKTTLCRRIRNEYVDITLRQPTVGAVLHSASFFIAWKSKIWSDNVDLSLRDVKTTRMATLVTNMEESAKEADLQTGSQDQPGRESLARSSAARREARRKVLNEAFKVRDASFENKSDGVFLSLWDMGGYTSFQATHNVFISSHGVYLLVFRLTDLLMDKMETDRLKKWIRLIGTFSSGKLNAPKLKPHDPPLIFVGTFLDELKKSTSDYDERVRKMQSNIAKFPELTAHRFVRFCTADNSLGNDDMELDVLRGLITESAVHQDQWDQRIPARWLKLEMELLKAREGGTRILTFAEVIEMNKESIVTLTDEEEMKLALEFLHCTRSVVYFREFDHVITDPQWLADFFSILLTDDQFLPKGDHLLLTRDLDLYMTKGELTDKLTDSLLSLEKNQAFRPYKSILLALMEKFGLIVKTLLTRTTTANAQFSETYTIPSKLMELQNVDEITSAVSNLKQRNLAVSKTLCFVFKDVYVPDELFHRVFAEIMRRYRAVSLSTNSFDGAAKRDQATVANTACLYLGFGCFEVDDLSRVIVSMHAERSAMAVTVISPTESNLPADSGPRLRLAIEQILRETLEMSNQLHFRYVHQLHCNFHLSPYDTPVQLYGVINSEKGVLCKGSECEGQHTLSRTDTIFWNITEDSARFRGNRDIAGTTEIRQNTSDRRPSPRELGRLSRLINSSRLELFFLELGLPDLEIEDTKCESYNMPRITLITKLFLKWTIAYPNKTINDIQQAMEAVGMATDGIDDVLGLNDESVVKDMVPFEFRNRVPSEHEIRKIVDNIDKMYFNLCLELGLSPPTIAQCELCHSIDFKTKMSALLQCWIDRFQKKATIVRLLSAMKVCQMDWHKTATIYLVTLLTKSKYENF